jgi:AraC-like DNA-binding protein
MPPETSNKPQANTPHGHGDIDVVAFVKKMAGGPPNIALWDLLPEVAFWVKDHLGRFIFVNQTLADQARMPKADVIGKKDVDCFPPELAQIYMMDDESIIAGGPPITHKSELVMTPEGGVEWRKTSKLPVLDARGSIIGTTGVSRKVNTNTPLPTEYAVITDILNYIHDNLEGGLSIQQIASDFHLSLSTLERYIRTHLRTTPNDLLIRIKMQRAHQLLVSSMLNITEISYECGYESVSSFSRAFRKHSGMTAMDYRNTHQRQTSSLK